MMPLRRMFALLVLLVGLALPAQAQGWGAPAADPVEASLRMRDEMVRNYYVLNFPADPRYEAVLNRIATRVNARLHEVFPNSEEQVTYGVFLSNMGFNGVSWYRIVILDSLLLDTLRRVAESTVVSGKLENPYTDQLAAYIGQLGTQGGYGAPLRNRYSIDPENPYQIPAPPGLTHASQARAEAVFEDLLASWVCHELAHCYLGHARTKIEDHIRLQQQYGGAVPPWVLEAQIQQYLNYQVSPQRELEADRYGAMIAFRAGYSLEGFRRWYSFIDRIEEHTGAAYAQSRTHPRGSDRFRTVQQVWNEVKGGG